MAVEVVRAGAGLLALVIGALLVTACGSAQASPEHVTVIATTPILGDIAGQVARCAGGTSATLMPNGVDPHDFSPSARQIAQLEDADLVVANGLGLESGMARALASARADGADVLEIGPLVQPIPLAGSTAPDPHIWFSLPRMATAATLIGSALAQRTGDDAYATCGTQVADTITAAHADVAAALSSVPEGRRILVTDHDALGYLAAEYGYRIAGSVVPSSTTLAEPSSADIAALADEVRHLGVSAIFANTALPDALAQAVAAEAGRDVRVVPLAVETLGPPGSSTGTYLGMVTADARAIAGALGGTP